MHVVREHQDSETSTAPRNYQNLPFETKDYDHQFQTNKKKSENHL
jgi:hypothetical protein